MAMMEGIAGRVEEEGVSIQRGRMEGPNGSGGEPKIDQGGESYQIVAPDKIPMMI